MVAGPALVYMGTGKCDGSPPRGRVHVAMTYLGAAAVPFVALFLG